MLHIMSTV